MDKLNEATWRIQPMQSPHVIHHCSTCGHKMAFYSSDKFRLNSNSHKTDIWLIYKCVKCDRTWKLTIKKGIKPNDLPALLFDRFIQNDAGLAWQYAFDQPLIKQNGGEMTYTPVEYTVEGYTYDDLIGMENPLLVHLESAYIFELRLSALLAKLLGVSSGRIKKLAEDKKITASLKSNVTCPVMRCKIKSDVTVLIQPDWNL